MSFYTLFPYTYSFNTLFKEIIKALVRVIFVDLLMPPYKGF